MTLVIFCKKCKFGVALKKHENGKCHNCGSYYYWDNETEKHKIDSEEYEQDDLLEYISLIILGFGIIGLILY